MNCNHHPYPIGADEGYIGSVARPPYTLENRGAHGGICRTEACSLCGAQRAVLINGKHREYGSWGPTRAQREEEARRDEAYQAQQHEMRCRVMARKAGIEVLSAADDQTVSIHYRGSIHTVTLAAINAAADQHDNGDGRVPLYTGVRFMAQDAFRRRAAMSILNRPA